MPTPSSAQHRQQQKRCGSPCGSSGSKQCKHISHIPWEGKASRNAAGTSSPIHANQEPEPQYQDLQDAHSPEVHHGLQPTAVHHGVGAQLTVAVLATAEQPAILTNGQGVVGAASHRDNADVACRALAR